MAGGGGREASGSGGGAGAWAVELREVVVPGRLHGDLGGVAERQRQLLARRAGAEVQDPADGLRRVQRHPQAAGVAARRPFAHDLRRAARHRAEVRHEQRAHPRQRRGRGPGRRPALLELDGARQDQALLGAGDGDVHHAPVLGLLGLATGAPRSRPSRARARACSRRSRAAGRRGRRRRAGRAGACCPGGRGRRPRRPGTRGPWRRGSSSGARRRGRRGRRARRARGRRPRARRSRGR